MPVNRVNVRPRGFATTEIVVSIGLMAVMAGLAADWVRDYRHVRDQYFWRQAAAWAADAQLQRYRAGAALDSRPPAGLVPEEITFETILEPGRDQWRGFDRVTVVATAVVPGNKPVRERITGYLPAEVKP